jgi:serine protease Do
MIMNSIKLASLLIVGTLLAVSGRPLPAQQAPSPDASERMQRMLHRMSLFEDDQSWLGIELEDVTQAKVQQLKLPGEYGAIVSHVEENSPAAKAGLKVNDVILEFGGMRVWSAAQLKQLVNETPPGRNVSLRISRNGRQLNVQVTTATAGGHAFAWPSFHAPRINFPPGFFNQLAPFETRGRLGIEAEDLTPQLASYFGVKQGKGVLITQVEAGSPAAKAGLKAGDCLVSVDSKEVASLSDLRSALRDQTESNHTVTLGLVRKGHEESVRVNLQPPRTPNPEQEAENFSESVERHVRELERQLPSLQREEAQLESCLAALETHIFEPEFPSKPKPAVIRRPNGNYLATGPGCPMDPGDGGK